MKNIIFIILGGSLITEKNTPYTARLAVVKRIASEFREILAKNKDSYFLLGNGAGSFGHYATVQHTMPASQSPLGFAVVADSVERLNRIVVGELLAQNIPAFSLHPSSILISSRKKMKKLFLDSLLRLLENNIIPVIYGDIVFDDMLGFEIFSTESLFGLLIPALREHHYTVEKIIHLTVVDGVLDNNKKVIAQITTKSFPQLKQHLFGTEGYDVTGGMLHKIEQSLSYAKQGISTYIVNGAASDKRLTNAIVGKQFVGTLISS